MRDFYQGLLQIAVALYHFRNGNFKGAMGLFQKGSACLKRVPAVCQRVDVKGLLAEASAMERALAELGEERMGEVSPQLVPRLKTVDAP